MMAHPHPFAINWDAWDGVVAKNGVTIDRPLGTPHPRFPEIVYPIDYGFVNNTTSTDGEEVDVFVGTAETGIVGVIATVDYRKQDREIKLLYNCSLRQVYLVNGFINFDQQLMSGTLVLRYPPTDIRRGY